MPRVRAEGRRLVGAARDRSDERFEATEKYRHTVRALRAHERNSEGVRLLDFEPGPPISPGAVFD